MASNSDCGAMDLAQTTAKIDIGYLPGDTTTSRSDLMSRSLYLSGRSAGVLAGRHAISKSIDVSRGATISMWLRRGNATAPLVCEKPDERDELAMMLKLEHGQVSLRANCARAPCDGSARLSMSVCNVTEVYSISQPDAFQVNFTKEYTMNRRTTLRSSYLVPRCLRAYTWAANASGLHFVEIVDTTDQSHIRVGLRYGSGDGAEPRQAQLLVPLHTILQPRPSTDQEILPQTCTCVPVLVCDLPPCAPHCTCEVPAGANCTLSGITSSVLKANEGKKRTLLCTLPSSRPGAPTYDVSMTLEYSPDSTPPTWSQIQRWRRVQVYSTEEFESYSYTSQSIYQSQRGVRHSVNANELTRSQSDTSMVRCPRGQACYNQKARIMIRQNAHGQGDFDAWSIDNLKVESRGGIIDDTRIVAVSPPARQAFAMIDNEVLAWRKDGRLAGKAIKSADVLIAMNNQSYERAGSMNFCR